MRLVVHFSENFPCFFDACIADLLGVCDSLVTIIYANLKFLEALKLYDLANHSQSLKDIL
jgi:hypothetical protein